MKKKSLIVLVTFLISSIVQSQDNNAYYNAIDYCNCKFALAYTQKYANTHVGSKEEKSFNLIQSKLDCKIEKPLSYDSLTNLLKQNNFNTYVSSSAPEFKHLKEISPESFTKEQAVQQIIDGIFSNRKLSSVISQSGFMNQKDALAKHIDEYFEGKFPNGNQQANTATNDEQKINNASQKITIDELQSEIDGLKERTTPGPFSLNWLSVIITLIAVAIIFLFLGTRISDLKERVDRYRDETRLNGGSRNNTNWNQASSSNSNSREWLDFKKAIERTVGDMNDAISRIQEKIFLLDSKNLPNQESLSNLQSNISKSPRDEVLYASIPNTDGSFSHNALTDGINPTESFYKLTLKDSNKASFEFLNDERAAKNASSSPELILYPVCKIKNSPIQNVKRIKTTTPGVLVKRNDRWELETPAVIEYE